MDSGSFDNEIGILCTYQVYFGGCLYWSSGRQFLSLLLLVSMI